MSAKDKFKKLNDIAYMLGSGIAYDYDSVRDCKDYGCDGICRCSKIVNLEIMNYTPPTRHFYLKDEPVFNYCIDRVFAIFHDRLSDISNWKVPIDSGYYGEEIGHPELLGSLGETISDAIFDIQQASTDSDRIRAVLELEYSRLLPELVTATFSLKTVALDRVHARQTEYMLRLDHSKIGRYKEMLQNEPQTPIGIVLPRPGYLLPSGPDYRLIDGYHRYTAATKLGLKEVAVIVGENG